MLAVQTSPLLLNNTKNIRFYSVYVLLSCNEGSAVQYKAAFHIDIIHFILYYKTYLIQDMKKFRKCLLRLSLEV